MPTNEITMSAADKLLETARLAVDGVNGLSEVVGLIRSKVNGNSQRITALEDRMTTHEEREAIEKDEADKMNNAVHKRVYKVLEIPSKRADRTEGQEEIYQRYFRGFIGLLYWDLKKKSRMGSSYRYTKRRDYDQTMRDIEIWFPDQGVQALKEELDMKRSVEAKIKSEQVS